MRLLLFLSLSFLSLVSTFGQIKPRNELNQAYFNLNFSFPSSSARTQGSITKLTAMDILEASGNDAWSPNVSLMFDYPNSTSMEYKVSNLEGDIIQDVRAEQADSRTLIFYYGEKTRDIFKLNDKLQVTEGVFEYWDEESEEWKLYETAMFYEYDALGNRTKINLAEGVIDKNTWQQENIKEMKYEGSRLVEVELYTMYYDKPISLGSKTSFYYNEDDVVIRDKVYWYEGIGFKLRGETDYIYSNNQIVFNYYRYYDQEEEKELQSIITYELDKSKPFVGVGEQFHDAHYTLFFDGPVENIYFDFKYQIQSLTSVDLVRNNKTKREYTYGEFNFDDSNNVTSLDPSLSKSIKIYPNPTSDYLIVEEVSNAIATLTNLIGINYEVSIINGKANLSSLPKGVYLLSIEGKEPLKILKK
ncbi:T9SS type A sorting domain-containing protein [Flammeovirga sp. EKP202]|uniref:T9SS type A sorting domain-containing protein n=1 Tax=Flammeovirga sp. EKP202 TaxID=2770592 RepID=UPI00165EF4AE|nr:T9SS type A sorting domain-containing protein [Flammeovirga sp. EKP202]MBD0405379.1 T9SS type A sorting domain-containing protein [Flammeovirga sp. EKP202]